MVESRTTRTTPIQTPFSISGEEQTRIFWESRVLFEPNSRQGFEVSFKEHNSKIQVWSLDALTLASAIWGSWHEMRDLSVSMTLKYVRRTAVATMRTLLASPTMAEVRNMLVFVLPTTHGSQTAVKEEIIELLKYWDLVISASSGKLLSVS